MRNNEQQTMRSPISSYYGGKASLVHRILPLIPEHSTFIEPFFGGGSLFFSLPYDPQKRKNEIINDTNDAVINFFKVLKNNFDELKKKVDTTLYSRTEYKVALTMYKAPHLFNPIQIAWSFWTLTVMGFSGTIGSFSYDKNCSKARTLKNKRLRFTKELSERLATVQIDNTDGLKILKSRTSKNSFAFIDPPYVDKRTKDGNIANQGHYSGYSKQDYINLLNTLENIEGKFLLTTYDSELLTEHYVKKNNWYQIRIEKPLTAYKSVGRKRKKKVEVFTANYDIVAMQKTNSELS